MALHLSSKQVAELEAALQSLLSPLEHPDLSAWQTEALEHVHRIVDAHFSSFWMPDGNGKLSIVGRNLGDDLLHLLHVNQQQALTGAAADPLMTRATSSRLRNGSGVYHESDIVDRETVERSPLYQEAFHPAGVRYTTGMSTPLDGAEGGLVFAFERDDADGYRESGLQQLRLLLPAFEAGCAMAHRHFHRRDAIARMLDALDEPVFLMKEDGRPLHRSAALRRLLADEPDSEPLMEAVHAHAEKLRQRRFSQNTKSQAWESLEVPATVAFRTRKARYELKGSYPGAAAVGVEAVMVTVHAHRDRAVDVGRLQESFGLTAREIEVAELVAEGRTNRDVAEALHISPHTVKHHVSHIMAKLEVPSRSGVAARLFGDLFRGDGQRKE